ncbi:hypothetical protein SAMN04488120_11151 [Fontimonas thermophila]|uniref:Uncharacterized protein n=1 Tax=Fontimonas thermophila TaxID=1076937 RepID=A0A1I2K3U0_9GAMM|nr:hypothetical protein [Fontimonas thermophila]SFF59867.1 hypothetical protein SAMN04488120_11151 [Fontimonas thermophila]
MLQQLEAVLATPIAKTAVAAANTQTGGSVPDRVASPAVAQTPAVVTRAPSPDRDDRIAGLMARLAALEQRHSADLAALEARLAAAEQRHSADLAALNARLTALEQRHNADLAALEAQHKTLEAFKKAYEQDCETLRRHFDTALEAGIRRAREQASADIRATLLRALVRRNDGGRAFSARKAARPTAVPSRQSRARRRTA